MKGSETVSKSLFREISCENPLKDERGNLSTECQLNIKFLQPFISMVATKNNLMDETGVKVQNVNQPSGFCSGSGSTSFIKAALERQNH